MKKLVVNNVTIQYEDDDNPVVKNVSFELELGESILIAGASGCGKSTLALAIAGLIPRAIEADMYGEVYLDSIDLSTLKAGLSCQKVGMVFQDPETQFCMLTVEEEIAFGLENINLPVEEMQERIDDVMLKVGLENHRHTRIDRLSGGYKQKLALACILSQRPPVIILDEPTANLDPLATIEFFRLVKEIKAKGEQTIILIEHKLEVPALFIDQIMVLDQGEIVEMGPTRDVFANQGALLKKLGVWQPYASEVSQILKENSIDLIPFPLTVDELCSSISKEEDHGNVLRQIITSQIMALPVDNNTEMMVNIRNVDFSYKQGNHITPVLSNVSWSIKKGSFTALIGQNGTGKSTLGRLIMGLLSPTKGSIYIQNKEVEKIHRKRLTQLAGFVFQNPEHQFVTDTVWDEVAYALKIMNKSEDEIDSTVKDLLIEFQLTHRAEANPFSLSQGEKRRLSVAAMLSTGQELLILDELSFGQDYINTYRLMNLVLNRQRSGCTIIIITHDMRLVSEYATDVGVLHGGKMVFTGSTTELFKLNNLLEDWSLSTPLGIQILQSLEAE